MWLVVTVLMQIYMKGASRAREIQNVWHEEKRNTRKCFAGAMSSTQGDKKSLKKKLLNGIKGITSELRARPQPAKLPTCKKELRES